MFFLLFQSSFPTCYFTFLLLSSIYPWGSIYVVQLLRYNAQVMLQLEISVFLHCVLVGVYTNSLGCRNVELTFGQSFRTLSYTFS
jgi:hypothetical protein